MLSNINSTVQKLQVVEAVVTRADIELFRPVSFSCTSGQVIHLVGQNGIGKTTLMRSICGVRSLYSGKILWDSQDIKKSETFYLNSAYLGHRDAHSPLQTAWESLHFYQKLYTRDANSDNIDPLLNKLGLLPQADVLVDQLSFGQKRKLAIARLLLSERTLWMLDEPFSGVDQAGRELIEEICLQHISSMGMIVLTNHGALSSSRLLDHVTKFELQ